MTKYYFLALIIFIGTSSPLTGMSRTNKVLSQLVMHCLNFDDIKTIISPEKLAKIKQYYLTSEIPTKVKRISNFLKNIIHSKKKEAYFKTCETDAVLRSSILNAFLIPHLLVKDDGLQSFIPELGDNFVTKTLPDWMHRHDKSITPAVDSHTSYTTLCLYCVCDLKDIPKLRKILVSDLCHLDTLNLAPLAPWAQQLIRFLQLPFVKELTEKQLPGIENLITLHIERPKLQLAKRPYLCAYIADPDSIYSAYMQKNYWKRDSYLQTVLMWACMFGQEEHVRMLLSYPFSRAWINLTDIFEATALEYAVQQGNITIIKLLLAAEAQPSLSTLLATRENNQRRIIPMLIKAAKEQAQIRTGHILSEQSNNNH